MTCPTCGITAQQREVGRQMVELIEGAAQRRLEASVSEDDSVALLHRMAERHGFTLTKTDDQPEVHCTCGKSYIGAECYYAPATRTQKAD